jgi:adenosine kinase
MAQIASFYAGAMTEAREIELRPIADRHGGRTQVLIGPNDPEAMRRHTQECRDRGYDFIADPSQQLAFGDGEMIRDLVDGAAILFSNEYEAALITQKSGWSADEVRDRVGTWVITLGAHGVRIEGNGVETIHVPAVPDVTAVEPTGVGDAFRAGFLAALEWGLGHQRAAQLGCALAAYVVERVGTQEYTLHRQAFIDRFTAAYGEEAAAEIADKVRTRRP